MEMQSTYDVGPIGELSVLPNDLTEWRTPFMLKASRGGVLHCDVSSFRGTCIWTDVVSGGGGWSICENGEEEGKWLSNSADRCGMRHKIRKPLAIGPRQLLSYEF